MRAEGLVGALSGPLVRRDATPARRDATRRLVLMAVVAVAYYAGAQLGSLLRLPPSTPAALWPPNAIVLAALVLTAPRDWWLVLLAALPAHLAVELPTGWPIGLVGALFLTNITEALIGAVGVRLLSDAPSRLDTLQRMAAFIAAAGLLAPIVSSFGDAGAVAIFKGEPYWEVWRARTFSNILSDLTIAPAIVAVVGSRTRWLTRADPTVRLEAALLSVVLLAMAALAFVRPTASESLVSGAPGVLVAFLLPCLLWAAVRFGPAGASLALVTTAIVAEWAGLRGRGPFERLPVDQAVLALQLFLSVIAVPVLCVGALIEERWTAEGEMADRLAFEELLSRLSASFVEASGRAVDETAAIWLGKLAVYLKVDCAWLLRSGLDPPSMWLASSWTAPHVPIRSPVDPMREFGGLVVRALGGDATAIEFPGRPDDRDRGVLDRLGLGSMLCLPVSAGGRVFGAIVLADGRTPRRWPEALRARLQLVSEVFANALARQSADVALRAGEALKSSILASLSSGVAVLDRSGRIIAVNERWNALAHDQHEIVFGDVGIGANYLDLCFQAAMRGAPYAGTARAGIEAVLGRSRSSFTLEYETDGPAGERWAVLTVVPLSGAQGGAVVTHTDNTERRHAEIEAQRSRQELAHFTRVSTVGELTTSVAHQLNQPLTGILANAQAARRLLDASSPDLPEVRSILDDIVDDDQRAAEVIRQMRDLMRRSPAEPVLLDLNSVVQGVVHLVSSDAVIRSVVVSLDLTPDMPIVPGNRVDLQQVVLNLLMNALEAVGSAPERRITVRTRLVPPLVDVEVEDSGPGLAPGDEARVFEPFYSTRPGGMGMGLSIARSIVEAHQGTIAAHARQPHGVLFRFSLPLASARAV